MLSQKNCPKKNSTVGEVLTEVKEFAFFMVIIVAAVAVSSILFGCGEVAPTTGSSPVVEEQVVEEQPTPNEPSEPTDSPDQPNNPTPNVSGGGGGGGGGSSPPAPECTVNEECSEGFECVEQHCVALPECREDIPCADPNNICSEQNTCVPKPCTEDSECVEPGFCLPDRSYEGEGELPTICREKSCPAIGETVVPESIVIPEECTEENTTIVFNLLQNVVHPDLSILSEAIKICELDEEKNILQERFDNLDAVRVLLDNKLAECNIGEGNE